MIDLRVGKAYHKRMLLRLSLLQFWNYRNVINLSVIIERKVHNIPLIRCSPPTNRLLLLDSIHIAMQLEYCCLHVHCVRLVRRKPLIPILCDMHFYLFTFNSSCATLRNGPSQALSSLTFIVHIENTDYLLHTMLS